MNQMSSSMIRDMYRTMSRIREFEERLAELLESGEVKCPCHLYTGQEAIATGVCAALRTEDYVWGGHRSHGHFIAKGGSMPAMMAEIYGKSTGCSKGRGGSMHLLATDVGILGTVPLVAATIPLAAGTGLASKLRDDGRVSVAFFGDGATEEGHFHESVNLAAVYKLPVLFVCENNQYASHMSLFERRSKDNIFEAGNAHGVATTRVDGNDVLAVYETAVNAIDHARNGKGPTLIECTTYRWRGHVGPAIDTDVGVKRKDDLADWKAKDPIKRARKHLIKVGIAESELDSIVVEVKAEVAESIQFARVSPYPKLDELTKHVFIESREA